MHPGYTYERLLADVISFILSEKRVSLVNIGNQTWLENLRIQNLSAVNSSNSAKDGVKFYELNLNNHGITKRRGWRHFSTINSKNYLLQYYGFS